MKARAALAVRTAALALVAALALAAAGCGGDDESADVAPAVEWAGGVCTAITDWTDSLDSAKQTLMENPSRDGLGSALDEVQSATDTLADDVDDLGTPDTTAGAQAKDTVDNLSETLQTSLDEIQDTVDGASDLGSVASAFTSITGTLSTMSAEIRSAYNTLAGSSEDAHAELRDAFEQAESCDSVTPSS